MAKSQTNLKQAVLRLTGENVTVLDSHGGSASSLIEIEMFGILDIFGIFGIYGPDGQGQHSTLNSSR